MEDQTSQLLLFVSSSFLFLPGKYEMTEGNLSSIFKATLVIPI